MCWPYMNKVTKHLPRRGSIDPNRMVQTGLSHPPLSPSPRPWHFEQANPRFSAPRWYCTPYWAWWVSEGGARGLKASLGVRTTHY